MHILDSFNNNTNLLISGNRFVDLTDNLALVHALRGFGAIVEGTVSPDSHVVFASQWNESLTLAVEQHRTSYPLVIADTSGAMSVPGYTAASTDTRPGVRAFNGPTRFYVVDCSRRHDWHGHAQARLDWAREFMPVTRQVAHHLAGLIPRKRVGIVLILEPKTAVLALSLQELGAEVAVYAPDNEVDAAVAQALRDQGVTVFSDPEGPSQMTQWQPDLLIDDGGHLIPLVQTRGTLLGAAEETTSGVRPLRELARTGGLHVPVVAVNDADSKTLFDNRFGTGQTCVFAIDHLAGGTRWAVIGFGPVGAGVAQAAQALGKSVSIVEKDPVRALEAMSAGYPVLSMEDALHLDVVVSATGYPETITDEHLNCSDATFAVAGGAPREAPETVLAAGHGINYTLAEGNPVEIMDLSFACQLFALKQLLTEPLQPGVHALNPDYDREVSRIALAARHGNSYRSHSSEPASPTLAEPPATVVYSAATVVPVTAPTISDGAVAVRDGRIIHVGDRAWVIAALKDEGVDFVEEYWDGVLTPGLINAHTHLQYTSMSEVGSRFYLGFEDWMNAFDAVYDAGPQDWLAASLEGAKMALASGTTSAADVVTDIEAAPALAQSGLHGVAYWEVMGWSNRQWREHGKERTIRELRSIPPLPGVGVSPHAPYSLDVQPLLDVPDLVRNLGLRLHIHLGEAHFERETRTEEEWKNRSADSFKELRRLGVGVSSTEFVDQLGVLGPDCHIAHGVYMSDKDRALLRARGTSVALCPRSNQVIGLDAPPIAAYLKEGNQISIGTDSLASSPSLDLLEDVSALYTLARQQGYADRDLHSRLIKAATLGGAGSLGLRAGKMRTGQLAVGASADLAFFDVDSIEELVEAGGGTCRRTLIAGEEKYRA